jgi:hypothetical protein
VIFKIVLIVQKPIWHKHLEKCVMDVITSR